MPAPKDCLLRILAIHHLLNKLIDCFFIYKNAYLVLLKVCI
ncbi:hypothetical protein NEOC95_000199 [Neochlamydia sp. AcF95]|nr:hypothetical protein [Neochlamydia sp. AcF95]